MVNQKKTATKLHTHTWKKRASACVRASKRIKQSKHYTEWIQITNTIRFNHIRTEAIIILNNRNIISNVVRYTQNYEYAKQQHTLTHSVVVVVVSVVVVIAVIAIVLVIIVVVIVVVVVHRCHRHHRHRHRVTFHFNWLRSFALLACLFAHSHSLLVHTHRHNTTHTTHTHYMPTLWESGIMNE